ncbi:hypothetical protein LEN26_017904 [Aphanomyces euteiches]|nr:hypothetical protein LEN26_017904 [Aphanomyces euteiches]
MGWIWAVGVALEGQGKGYCRYLMEKAIDDVRAQGMTEIWFTTDKDVNVTIYKKLGFQVMTEKVISSSGIKSWTMKSVKKQLASSTTTRFNLLILSCLQSTLCSLVCCSYLLLDTRDRVSSVAKRRQTNAGDPRRISIILFRSMSVSVLQSILMDGFIFMDE